MKLSTVIAGLVSVLAIMVIPSYSLAVRVQPFVDYSLSANLEGVVSNKDAWTELRPKAKVKTGLDFYIWKWTLENSILLKFNPIVSYGSQDWYTGELPDYYTSDLKNWKGRNTYKRSILRAEEAYAEIILLKYFYFRYGLIQIQSGAVTEFTPTDSMSMDYLNPLNPEEMPLLAYYRGIRLWGFELKYIGRFFSLENELPLPNSFGKTKSVEGKLQFGDNNDWQPDFPYELRGGTHGGECPIEILQLGWSNEWVSALYTRYKGTGPSQHFQVHENELEPDYYPKDMHAFALAMMLNGYSFNGAFARIKREEWLPRSAVVEASLSKEFPFLQGDLELGIQTIQDFTLKEGRIHGANRYDLWKKWSPENYYLKTWMGKLDYRWGKSEAGLAAYLKKPKSDLGWKADAYYQYKITPDFTGRISVTGMDNFFPKDRYQATLTLNYSWKGFK